VPTCHPIALRLLTMMSRHKLPAMHPTAAPETDPSALNILALDTSTERLALALQGQRGRWTVLADGGAQASATLLPQVHALMARAGLQMADLDAIAFGRGPGAFTGLRTACAVAQGLAFGLGKPVLPIDSLLVVAEDARLQRFAHADTLDIAVAMDARMNEAYAGRYRWAQGAWHTLLAPGLYALPTLAVVWADAPASGGTGLQAVAGSALAAFGDRVPWPAGALAVALEHDRAAALLNLAVQAARAGVGVDAALALPLYLRDKVAQTTQEREAVRAAAQAATAAPAVTP
jgi:tRNA threonylcarbamoyladenosine biosynthesis protein TsaB